MFCIGKSIYLHVCAIIGLLSLKIVHTVDATLKKTPNLKEQISNTGLLSESNEETLLISTLDGALHAIAKSSGALKWTLKDDPVIHNPTDSSQPPLPQFFPNPQDGSLYRYTLGRSRDPLKKLPFTIPQLVANSPCRSSDGIFYLGKKVDSWVGVDSITGEKQLTLDMDRVNRKCPKPSRNTVYFGRTLYNIILYEATTGNKWNISFAEYATGTASALENYDLVHYTSTGEGSILTIDQRTGSLLWTLELDSPLVAMYQLSPNGGLMTVPTTTVASQTLQHFTKEFMQLSHHNKDDSDGVLIKKLSPTIYIGECSSGVYAIPTLVDASTVTISRKGSQLLLEGPPGSRGTIPQASQSDKEAEEKPADVLLLGYYEIPENGKVDLAKVTPEDLLALNDRVLPLGITHKANDSKSAGHTRRTLPAMEEETIAVIWDGFDQIRNLNMSFVTSGFVISWWGAILHAMWLWFTDDILNIFVVIITLSMGGIVILLYRQAKTYAQLTREMSSGRMWSQGFANSSGSGGSVTAVAEELENGNIRVGKIVFDPQQLLGKGCDGTFVFQGTFDGRSVAVKRVLPGCFSIADREVDLLRESDQHANVIRYFCTEQCRQFRYIALELCGATLEDFIQGQFKADISTLSILFQASSGLQHLHNLDIVHRDIKPHNVLLSIPNSRGEVRAMISDFGLCKRLETGRMSFSKRSGITGTEGWIAPEMMLNTSRPTCKVDIFSLGCVYYYVLTQGKHPFGSVLHRQSYIISGRYDLQELDDEINIVSKTLIEKMLSSKPAERPPISAVLNHPFYWTPERQLAFFQDVSDRVEKESGDSFVVMSLERGGLETVKGDWRQHMHPVIAEDLRKFRDYKGQSVRDLLRALRNKRNHYRELKEEARMVFGRIPDEYVVYWTERFPKLLLHSWCAMTCVKTEPIFSKYYDLQYTFSQETYLENSESMVSSVPDNQWGEDSIDSDHTTTIDKEYKQENYAFAPNNASWVGSSPSARSKNKHHLINNPQNLLDSLLWRSGKKAEAKTERETKGPVWVISKPRNTFEPSYKMVESRPAHGIEGPWRKTSSAVKMEELCERDKVLTDRKDELVSIQTEGNNGSSVDKEKIGNLTDSEGSKETLNQDITDKDRTSCLDNQENVCSREACTILDSVENAGNKNDVDLGDQFEAVKNRRGNSQVRFRTIASPEKKVAEVDKHIKIVTGTGKKKKAKKITANSVDNE